MAETCFDYRHVNDVTKDRYPLARTDDALRILGGNRYFTSLDLPSGFWQVPISEEDREKTAFMTPDGLFQFMLCRLACVIHQQHSSVRSTVAGLKWKNVFGVSAGRSKSLRAVFAQLREASLKMKPRKCSFEMEQQCFFVS